MRKLLLVIVLALVGMTNSFAESDYDYKVANAEGVEICYSVDNATSRTLVVVAGDAQYTGNVAVPNSVSIGGYSYSVVGIGDYAFYGCSQLTSVTLPSQIQKIGMCAFSNCSSLTSIEIPESVERISTAAFMGCSGLQSIAAKMSSPVSISSNAFQSVDKSSCTLYVPEGASSAYRAADVWSDFTHIEEFQGGRCGTGVKWSLVNGVLTVYGKGSVNDYNLGKLSPWNGQEVKTVNIEQGITGIGAYAFYNCLSAQMINIPNTVRSIGEAAFQYCEYAEFHIPYINGLSLGMFSFQNCTNAKFYYGASLNDLRTVSTTAFQDCSNATFIYTGAEDLNMSTYLNWWLPKSRIPNFVIQPSDWINVAFSAFSDCNNLKSLTIPAGAKVSSLNMEGHFKGCSSLTDLDIDLPELGYKSEGNKLFCTADGESYSICCATPALQIVEIPSALDGKPVVGIRESSFPDGISFVYIPKSVTTIASEVFGSSQKFIICLSDDIQSVGYRKSSLANSHIFAKPNVISTLEKKWGTANYYSIGSGNFEDVNQDGKVNATDVMQIYNYILSH